MRSLALSLAVLLCVSAAQAVVYDFEGLSANVGQALNGQSDASTTPPITWKASYVGNSNLTTVGTNGSTVAEIDPNLSSDRNVTTITNQGQGGLSSLFNIDPDYTCPITVSADFYMNADGPFMVGIWVDGTDPCAYKNGAVITSPGIGYKDNAMPNSENELVIQFGGRSGTYGWRLRGPAGNPNLYYKDVDPNMPAWPTAGADPNWWRMTLVINLASDDGNGVAVLSVENLDTAESWDDIMTLNMNLNNVDPYFKNPMNWTGWSIRDQSGSIGDNEAGYWPAVDNLTLVPEPATLSLVLLGGLAYLRRRR